jgi:hypothetical protein
MPDYRMTGRLKVFALRWLIGAQPDQQLQSGPQLHFIRMLSRMLMTSIF